MTRVSDMDFNLGLDVIQKIKCSNYSPATRMKIGRLRYELDISKQDWKDAVDSLKSNPLLEDKLPTTYQIKQAVLKVRRERHGRTSPKVPCGMCNKAGFVWITQDGDTTVIGCTCDNRPAWCKETFQDLLDVGVVTEDQLTGPGGKRVVIPKPQPLKPVNKPPTFGEDPPF